MRKRALAGWLLSVAGVGWAHAVTEPPADRPIVIKAAHLFDSVSGNLAEHGVVVVEGGKIKAVGSMARITRSSRWKRASPRCATWDPPTTSLSDCAMPYAPG